jgi:hypothetical protein
LKISKNKSCRGVIDLQLSQRVSYVLINGFVARKPNQPFGASIVKFGECARKPNQPFGALGV